MEPEEALKLYGLSDKELKVYLALLSTGQATVNQIAEKTDLVRTTTYDILKKLRENALVGSVVKNKILYFEAADPAKLIQILEEKRSAINDVLPNLRAKRLGLPQKPTLELFEGKEGIKTIYQDILEQQKPLAAISNSHYAFKVLPYFVPRFIKERVKRKIHVALLTERTKETLELLKKRDKQEFRQTRFVAELKNIPITEYVYGDTVAILGTKPEEPLGILIRHADFAHAQKIIFDLLWNRAK